MTKLANALPASLTLAAATGMCLATALPAQAAAPVRAASAPATMHRLPAAGYQCQGQLLTRKYARLNGRVVGQIELYYSTNRNVTIWACMRHAGVTLDRQAPTELHVITKHSYGQRTPTMRIDWRMPVRRYLGPVVIDGIRGNCVAATGVVVVSGKRVGVNSGVWCYNG